MTSTPQNIPSTHDYGATPTVAPSTAPRPELASNTNNSQSPANPIKSASQSANTSKSPSNSTSQSTGSPPLESYPEQKHAGKVGYGPNYHSGVTLEDKIEGLKDELKGKITHNPDLVKHGHDLLSGEERKKKLTGEDEPNPFESVDKDEKRVHPHSDNSTDQSKGQPVQGSAGKTTSKDQPQSREQQTSRHEGSQISSQHQSRAKEHTPQASGQSALPQGGPSSSPSVTFAGHRLQSQNQPTNASYHAAPSPSASQPSQETTGARPEFATHGAPRANPARMALNQGYGEGAKEQAATVDPTGTSEAEEQRKRNASEFATRPVDARQ